METHRPELIQPGGRYEGDRNRAAARRMAGGRESRSLPARLAANVRLHLGRREARRAPSGPVKEDPELVV